MSSNLKKIFLHDYHKENKAKFASFAGYDMPINYELGIIKEHLHVRKYAGVFDVSHMGQILITLNKHNIEALEKYIPLNFGNLKINKSYYSFMVNKNGGIIDDLIISKINFENKEYLFIVYNAGRRKEDEIIFTQILNEYNYLSNNSLLAIQGPLAKDVLNFLNLPTNFDFMESKIIKYFDNLLIVSRSGYTGEDGFEISIRNSVVYEFIQSIMENSQAKLCGLGSRDSLRLEAGLSLYGNELNENITPIEANLAWSIHKDRLEDPILNGREILYSQYMNQSKNIKIAFKSISKSILRSEMKLLDFDNNTIGFITSGGFSPNLNVSIGMGYIDSTYDLNKQIFCLIRGNKEQLKIVKLPFVTHNYKRR